MQFNLARKRKHARYNSCSSAPRARDRTLSRRCSWGFKRSGIWCEWPAMLRRVVASPSLNVHQSKNVTSTRLERLTQRHVTSGKARIICRGHLVMCNSFLKFKRSQFHCQCSYDISRWLWSQHNAPKILHQVMKHPVYILDKNRTTYRLTLTVFRCTLLDH
jgi:hypothetical protein